MDIALRNGDDVLLHPRAYQLEMLEENLRRNVIVATDTGSGETNIAIPRIRAELERVPWICSDGFREDSRRCEVIVCAVGDASHNKGSPPNRNVCWHIEPPRSYFEYQ